MPTTGIYLATDDRQAFTRLPCWFLCSFLNWNPSVWLHSFMTIVVLSCKYLYWSVQRSQCSDYVMSWSIRGSHPGRYERFLSSAERSDQSWHPPPFPPPIQWVPGYFGGGGQSDRNVKFIFTFTLRLCPRDVDRGNITFSFFFFNESRCRFISNALFYIRPGFKSGFGARFNWTKDITVIPRLTSDPANEFLG